MRCFLATLLAVLSVVSTDVRAQDTKAFDQYSTSRQAVPATTYQPNTIYYFRLPSKPDSSDTADQILAKAQFFKVELSPVGLARTSEAQIVDLFSASGVQVTRTKPWMEIIGKKSTMTIPNAKPIFFIQCERSEMLRMRVAHFKVHSDRRAAELEKEDQLNYLKHPVPHRYVSLGNDRWLVIPLEPLKPGEYGIAAGPDGPVADFSIPEDGK